MAQPIKDVSLQSLITEGKNPRGIPASIFIVSQLLHGMKFEYRSLLFVINSSAGGC